ncbi:MAG: helix-turn-helix domain-containing protein [Chloroflexi bacterium]|nr:helix-turn-helix domain-containing protein [Chloroflexota bacterium]
MTSLLDAWRAVDPTARLVSGSAELLRRPVRGVAGTRAAPPHLPALADGQLLVVDGRLLVDDRLDPLVSAVGEAGLAPVGLWVVTDAPHAIEAAGAPLPVLLGNGAVPARVDAVAGYLSGEGAFLAELSAALRLAAAEAALADHGPGAPAVVVAGRMRRGVAVSRDGSLLALVPRPAGRTLATRFAALHGRLFAGHAGAVGGRRHARDGLWTAGRDVVDGAVAWLFDDVELARADEVALDAMVVTLRAILRRASSERAGVGRASRAIPSTGDPLRDTLVAVARANGRIAPAARALGVHRNTVLYRLRVASARLGVDPRRAEDAIRILREAGPRD